MNDFERQFRETEAEIDRDWKRAKRLAWVGTVINLAIMGFFVWVIIMVMRYFGII